MPGPHCGTIGRMRLPDRRWAETKAYSTGDLRAGWDHRAEPDDLAGRLARLSAGHPSADMADDRDDGGLDPGDLDPGDLDRGGVDPGDLDPDGLDPGEAGSGDADEGASSGDLRPHRAGGTATWGELGDRARSPYRPWFGADDANDPWFAADLPE
jgi:hypothetical protein